MAGRFFCTDFARGLHWDFPFAIQRRTFARFCAERYRKIMLPLASEMGVIASGIFSMASCIVVGFTPFPIKNFSISYILSPLYQHTIGQTKYSDFSFSHFHCYGHINTRISKSRRAETLYNLVVVFSRAGIVICVITHSLYRNFML